MFASYTCPQIDKNIEHFKSVLESQLEAALQDIAPLYAETKEGAAYLKELCKSIYEESEDLFENVRSCNEDLRSAADHRIAELEQLCGTLEQHIDSLE